MLSENQKELAEIAAVVAQGLLAGTYGRSDRTAPSPEEIARKACEYAEAIIKEVKGRSGKPKVGAL